MKDFEMESSIFWNQAVSCVRVKIVRDISPTRVLLFVCFLHQEKLSDWISELQGRSENIEDLVSELELAYNSVEVNQADCEIHIERSIVP